MSSLRLTIPVQTAARAVRCPLQPAALYEQLAALPYADVQGAMGEAHELAYELNRVVLTAPARVALQEQFRLPYQVFEAYFRTVAAAGPVGAARKAPYTPPALRQLTREMAYGYKIALVQWSERRPLWGQDRLIAVALQGALRFLGLDLVEAMEQRRTQPHHLWHEMHQVYAYAEQQGLHQQAPPPPKAGHPAETCCVARIYAQCLLAGLADPFALPPGSVWDLYHYLDEWGGQAALLNDDHAGHPESCFLVDLGGQRGARPWGAGAPRTPPAQVRILDISGLSRALREHLERLRDGQAPGTLGLPGLGREEALRVLTQVDQAWHRGLAPRPERRPAAGWVEAAVGLSEIHRLLATDDPNPDPAAGQAGGAAPLVLRWDLVNHGISGLCAASGAGASLALSVGRLVLVRLPAAAGQRWLGDIRWVQDLGGEARRMGVRYLAQSAEAVMLRALVGNKMETHEQPALLTTLIPELGGQPVLVTRRGLYRQGRELSLRHGPGSFSVRPTGLVDSGSEFDCFRYVLARP